MCFTVSGFDSSMDRILEEYHSLRTMRIMTLCSSGEVPPAPNLVDFK